MFFLLSSLREPWFNPGASVTGSRNTNNYVSPKINVSTTFEWLSMMPVRSLMCSADRANRSVTDTRSINAM